VFVGVHKTMDTVTTAGDATGATTFAVNTMAIDARPQSAGRLARRSRSASVKTACQKDVPCGAAAQKLFEQNKLAVAGERSRRQRRCSGSRSVRPTPASSTSPT
jgi:ABC-type molybdate transport system substrate-binding protein